MRAAILSDQSAGITLFLPTNDAINATFNKFGLDMKGLLQNQHLCTEILQYHILPSPIEVCPACHCWCLTPHRHATVIFSGVQTAKMLGYMSLKRCNKHACRPALRGCLWRMAYLKSHVVKPVSK